ncbi:uncharacterized protein PRCAT00006327001 [Priceomyces carsonii]|uniref:uncharacterized protein n=1 Tax=Priceomyces carsonii TaxID=28549 RepID=UPI002ED7A6C1|nr:unnamed protein product [Priceomyces carsonii]
MSEEVGVVDIFYHEDTKELVLVEKLPDSYTVLTKRVNEVPSNVSIVSKSKVSSHLFEGRLVILDSTTSGTGRKDKTDVYKSIILPIFKEILELKYDYIATENLNSIEQFAKSLKDSNEDVTVIFISGDTSISEFINALPSIEGGLKLIVFPIPAGTGNSLALSLNISDPLEAVKKIISQDAIDPLNLYEVAFPNGSYHLSKNEKVGLIQDPLKFLVVLSWGFHASLVADSDTPEMRKHGIERFKLAAYSNLSQAQNYEGQYFINDQVFDGPFAYLVFTSAKKFEPTFEILPKGDILDDSLYSVSFKYEDEPDGKYILDIMGEVYDKGRHVEDKRVNYEKITVGDKITLKTKNTISPRKRRFCLDGSIILLPEASEQELSIKPTGNQHRGWLIYLLH